MRRNQPLTHRKTGEKYRFLSKVKRNSIFEFWLVKRVHDDTDVIMQKSLFEEGYERPFYLGETYGTNH